MCHEEIVVEIVVTAIILAHIYICGRVDMEGVVAQE